MRATPARHWPDGTVVDGELLAWRAGEADPAPFALLQKRIGRTRLGPAILAEAPVRLLAYALLEDAGQDLRGQPLHARRARLAALGIPASPLLAADKPWCWATTTARCHPPWPKACR